MSLIKRLKVLSIKMLSIPWTVVSKEVISSVTRVKTCSRMIFDFFDSNKYFDRHKVRWCRRVNLVIELFCGIVQFLHRSYIRRSAIIWQFKQSMFLWCFLLMLYSQRSTFITLWKYVFFLEGIILNKGHWISVSLSQPRIDIQISGYQVCFQFANSSF